MNLLRRVAPAILLFFLSPLVAEFVLGDLDLGQLGALVALAPFYGGGAILIREALRRSRRSWPSFLLLGFAYALVEEGIADQSLFNPDYLHLRLLDYGWLPALGTALPWAVYVIGIHIAWSLAVPIGLCESLFADRRAEPWLGKVGFGVAALLYCGGFALVLSYSLGQTPFRASPLQLGVSASLAAAAVAAAFLLFPPAGSRPAEAIRGAVAPWLLAAASLAGGCAFLLAYALGRGAFPWPLTLAVSLAAALALCAFFAWANHRREWGPAQSWAAALGGLLCYAGFGYRVDRDLHGPGGAAQHSLFVGLALAVALLAGLRARRAARKAGGTMPVSPGSWAADR